MHTIAAVSYDLSGTRYLFQNWSDAGAATHTITTPVTALTLTAGFTVKYKLTLTVDPPEAGSIALGVPRDADGYVSPGWMLITATANPGYQFLSWSGVTSGTRNPEATLVDRPSSLTAHFSGPPGVTVTTSPAGLSLTVDGAAYPSPHTFAWPPGSVHTIAAVSYDLSGTRYLFQNWSDAGAATHIVTTPVTALTLTAGFIVKYKLTLIVDPPEAGSIALGVPRDADGYVPPGWMLITATANPGYQFLSWSGVTGGTRNPEAILVDRPSSLTAYFRLLSSGSIEAPAWRPDISSPLFAAEAPRHREQMLVESSFTHRALDTGPAQARRRPLRSRARCAGSFTSVGISVRSIATRRANSGAFARSIRYSRATT